MFLRFVSPEIDRDSGVEAGIFCAAYWLRESGTLPDYEYEHLWELAHWFNRHLERPTRFSRSTRRGSPSRGICWFKPTANEHLAKIHEMIVILENNDVMIRMIKSPKVGYVVYEDEHQVVAEPVKDMRL